MTPSSRSNRPVSASNRQRHSQGGERRSATRVRTAVDNVRFGFVVFVGPTRKVIALSLVSTVWTTLAFEAPLPSSCLAIWTSSAGVGAAPLMRTCAAIAAGEPAIGPEARSRRLSSSSRVGSRRWRATGRRTLERGTSRGVNIAVWPFRIRKRGRRNRHQRRCLARPFVPDRSVNSTREHDQDATLGTDSDRRVLPTSLLPAAEKISTTPLGGTRKMIIAVASDVDSPRYAQDGRVMSPHPSIQTVGR